MKSLISWLTGAVVLLAFVSTINAQPEQSVNPTVKIKWFGQASFQITTAKGTTIIIDPIDFKGYHMPPQTTADIVTISHEHPDHNCVQALSGTPIAFKGTDENLTTINKIDTTIADVKLYTVSSFHDPGRRRFNAIFVFEFDGIRLAHLGDIGTVLSEDQIASIGKVDILMVPVGGQYTITAAAADTIVNQLEVKSIVFPMHYKTDAFDMLPYTAEPFLGGKENIRRVQGNEFTVDPRRRPATREYVVLEY